MDANILTSFNAFYFYLVDSTGNLTRLSAQISPSSKRTTLQTVEQAPYPSFDKIWNYLSDINNYILVTY